MPKTEYIGQSQILKVYGESIKQVQHFKYLRSMMASSSSDLKRRKALAWIAFWKLEQLWRSMGTPVSTKLKLFKASCVTIILYRCKAWVISKDMESKINSFATSCHRILLGIKRDDDRVSNDRVFEMTKTRPLI